MGGGAEGFVSFFSPGAGDGGSGAIGSGGEEVDGVITSSPEDGGITSSPEPMKSLSGAAVITTVGLGAGGFVDRSPAFSAELLATAGSSSVEAVGLSVSVTAVGAGGSGSSSTTSSPPAASSGVGASLMSSRR